MMADFTTPWAVSRIKAAKSLNSCLPILNQRAELVSAKLQSHHSGEIRAGPRCPM